MYWCYVFYSYNTLVFPRHLVFFLLVVITSAGHGEASKNVMPAFIKATPWRSTIAGIYRWLGVVCTLVSGQVLLQQYHCLLSYLDRNTGGKQANTKLFAFCRIRPLNGTIVEVLYVAYEKRNQRQKKKQPYSIKSHENVHLDFTVMFISEPSNFHSKWNFKSE